MTIRWTHIGMQSHLSHEQRKIPVGHDLCHTGVHQTLQIWERTDDVRKTPSALWTGSFQEFIITFTALQCDQVTLIVQRLYHNFNKVELTLNAQKQTVWHLKGQYTKKLICWLFLLLHQKQIFYFYTMNKAISRQHSVNNFFCFTDLNKCKVNSPSTAGELSLWRIHWNEMKS